MGKKKKAEEDYNNPVDEEGNPAIPQKRYFRVRAHANPLQVRPLEHPSFPGEFDWHPYYPGLIPARDSNDVPTASPGNTEAIPDRCVRFLDIGCGYGGLTVALSKLFPDKMVLGMEIRPRIVEYVQLKIKALRHQHPGEYQNGNAMHANVMRHISQFFRRGQLEKIFFLFPDPHFKRSKHRHRIVSPNLLAEYAYVLRPGGICYTVTDVKDLHDWMVEHLTAHPLFTRMSEHELEGDPCIDACLHSTEEGNKVARNNGDKFLAVFRRV